MKTKPTAKTEPKMNQKALARLMAKRERIIKQIDRKQGQLANVNSALGRYSQWLADLTAGKS
jgi:hypothetical protein